MRFIIIMPCISMLMYLGLGPRNVANYCEFTNSIQSNWYALSPSSYALIIYADSYPVANMARFLNKYKEWVRWGRCPYPTHPTLTSQGQGGLMNTSAQVPGTFWSTHSLTHNAFIALNYSMVAEEQPGSINKPMMYWYLNELWLDLR